MKGRFARATATLSRWPSNVCKCLIVPGGPFSLFPDASWRGILLDEENGKASRGFSAISREFVVLSF